MPPPTTPTALPYIANTVAAIALIPTVSGAAFLFAPAAGLQQMRLTSSTRTATTSELGLVRMYAVRQCAMGLTTLAMWWTGAYRAMGLAGLPGLMLAIADGFAARSMVDEKEGWKHWGAAPFGLGLTAAMLYYTF